MNLVVALLSDVHHGPDSGYVRGSVALGLLEGALAQLGERHADLHLDLFVDLGDRVNSAEPEAARAELAQVAALFWRLDMPRVHLLGNDDITPRREQEALLGVALGNRSLELGGWQLVFLDTFDGSVEGTLTEATLAWLEQTLAANALPAVVFSHQPLDGEPLPGNVFFGGEYSYQAHPKGHEAARRVLERSRKVKLAVSGHAHWNHRVTVAGISYWTLGALAPLADEARVVGVYGLLELGDTSVRLEVFGREPQRYDLKVYDPDIYNLNVYNPDISS